MREGLDVAKFSKGTMYIIGLTDKQKDQLKIEEVFALYLIDLA